MNLLPGLESGLARARGHSPNGGLPLATAQAPTIVTDFRREEPALSSLGAARGFAVMLDFENREVEDLENVLGGPDREKRVAPHFLLPIPHRPAANKPALKKRPDNISELAVRRYLAGKSSLEETVMALYCGNVSLSRAAKTAKILWGGEADIGLIGRNAGVIERRILDWLRRPISTWYPYVFLRTMRLSIGKGGAREWCRVFVAVGVSVAGIREVLAVRLAGAEQASAWGEFVGDLRARGLGATGLFLGENEPQLITAVGKYFPSIPYQGDFEQMERAILQNTPVTRVLETADWLRAVREDGPLESAKAKLVSLQRTFRRLGYADAERTLAFASPFLHSFSGLPRKHWAKLRENTPFVRVMRDCREWTRVAGAGMIPDDLLLMVAARWRQASRVWAGQKFISFDT